MKKNSFKNIRNHLSNYYPLYIATFLFFWGVSYIQWVKYVSGRFTLNDIGYFDQALWTFITSGSPLHSIGLPDGYINWFSVRFSPLSLIVSVCYLCVHSVFSLCVIETIIVASTVIPIFLSTKALGLTKKHGIIISILFLIHPFTLNGVSSDFHEIALATPIISWAIYSIIKRKFVSLCIMSALLLMVKEQYGITLVGLGTLWIIKTKEWKKGVVLGGIGILAFVLIVFVIMPDFELLGSSSIKELNRGLPNSIITNRYGWLHSQPLQLIDSFCHKILLTSGTFIFFALLLCSFGPLSFLGLVFLLAGSAEILTAILSANPMPRSPYTYYSLPLAAVVTLGAVYGLSKVPHPKRFKFLLVASMNIIFLGYFLGPFPLPGSYDIWEIRHVTPSQLKIPRQVEEIRNILPEDASVSAQTNIGYFFSKRKKIYPFPKGEQSDFVILFLDYPFENFNITVFANPYDWKTYKKQVYDILLEKRRPILFFSEGWLVFGPGSVSASSLIAEKDIHDVLKRLDWMEDNYGSI